MSEKNRIKFPVRSNCFISTREAGSSEEIKSYIDKRGGELLEFPMIQTTSKNLTALENKLVRGLDGFEWIIFTSSNGVKYFFLYLAENKIRFPGHIKIAVIGNKTAESVQNLGYNCNYISKGENSEIFAAELKNIFGSSTPKVLLATGNLANNTLEVKLTNDTSIHRIDFYYTSKPEQFDEGIIKRIVSNQYEIIYFYSPSAINNFFDVVHGLMNIHDLRVACIGPTTKKTCVNKGITPIFTAEKPDSKSLFEATVTYLNNKK